MNYFYLLTLTELSKRLFISYYITLFLNIHYIIEIKKETIYHIGCERTILTQFLMIAEKFRIYKQSSLRKHRTFIFIEKGKKKRKKR